MAFKKKIMGPPHVFPIILHNIRLYNLILALLLPVHALAHQVWINAVMHFNFVNKPNVRLGEEWRSVL